MEQPNSTYILGLIKRMSYPTSNNGLCLEYAFADDIKGGTVLKIWQNEGEEPCVEIFGDLLPTITSYKTMDDYIDDFKLTVYKYPNIKQGLQVFKDLAMMNETLHEQYEA